MTALRRVQKEFRDLITRPVEGIVVTPKDENMFFWECDLKGPVGTPYQGGTFHFTIEFPDTFPFKPPTVTFTTKIYHPGINEEGHICLSMLRDEWKPATSLTTVLKTIYDKIGKPSPDDPFDTEVAAVLKNDEPKFKATAKEWVKKYAT